MTDLVLTLIGPDRPALVESVAERVTAHGGNWLESRMARLAGQFLTTDRLDAPMSGGGLFRAQARLQVPATLDVAKLREDLEHIANDLMVDLTLAPASPGETA